MSACRCFVVLSLLGATLVFAQTFDQAVTTDADVLDNGDGLLSLREAVLAANTSAIPARIFLPASTCTLTRVGAGEDAACSSR